MCLKFHITQYKSPMSDHTPNRPRRDPLPVYTPIDKCALSPFLSTGSQFHLSVPSSSQPVSVSYFSPPKGIHSGPRLEDLLIGMCDQCTAHIFRKKAELNQILLNLQSAGATPSAATASEVSAQKSVSKNDDVTPPKSSPSDSTCEGSDLKPTKLDLNGLEDSSIKSSEDFHKPRIIRAEHSSDADRIIRRRKRKSIDQLKMLYNEYKKNPNWNKTTMAEMALKTGLSEAQVYKWSWDQKKKKIEDD